MIAAALTMTTDVFLTSANILNVFRQASLTFLIASGLTLTILTAGLDLSVGANVGLSACLAATVMKSTGSIALGIGAGLGFGAMVGVLNGLMITLLKLPPFIATYGMLWTLNGFTYWFMGGDTIHGFSPGFRRLGQPVGNADRGCDAVARGERYEPAGGGRELAAARHRRDRDSGRVDRCNNPAACGSKTMRKTVFSAIFPISLLIPSLAFSQ